MATQTQYGKAYEFACLEALNRTVREVRQVVIVANTSLDVAKRAWGLFSPSEQKTMSLSAMKGVEILLHMEPKIIEDGNDILEISLQRDSSGQAGDVRDVLIIRRSINWEIGISVKHNHEAVKHSRLSPRIDFGKDWFGIPCSSTYFQEIEPIFNLLKTYTKSGKKWSEVPNKEAGIYAQLLNAFHKELTKLDSDNPGVIPGKLLEYLLGRNDFYKLISHDSTRSITLQCFNLHGTLNKASSSRQPSLKARGIRMPNRIYHFGYKDTGSGKSMTTLQLVMDEDWGITFRIHNASTMAEPSLKFDIQLTGIPSNLFTHHAQW